MSYGRILGGARNRFVQGCGNLMGLAAGLIADRQLNDAEIHWEFRSSVRRKVAPGKTRRGSVKVYGQTFVIYVIEVQRMREQKTWKYRYQVASKDSKDCDAIDLIYSDEHMRDGHYYEVRVNDNMRYPQVLELLREVGKAELPA